MLVNMGYGNSGSIQTQAVGDLLLIAFYYLLCIGEYTVKCQRDWSKWARKQTVQFKVEDVTFFKTDKHGILRCLPCNAPYSLIITAESTMLKLNIQKNGWKGVCVHQEANGEAFNCPVKALACWVMHIRENGGDQKALLSAIYIEGICYDVTGDDISKGLKMAATLLNYPSTRGSNQENRHTLTTQRGCEPSRAVRVLGHTNSEDGQVEGRDVQRVHQGRTRVLLGGNVLEDEAKLQVHQHLRKCLQRCHRQVPGGGLQCKFIGGCSRGLGRLRVQFTSCFVLIRNDTRLPLQLG